MASKFLAAALAFLTALFPGLQVVCAQAMSAVEIPAQGNINPQNISSLNLSLNQINDLIHLIQSNEAQSAGSPFGANLSQEDFNQMLQYLEQLKAYYGHSGRTMPRAVAQRVQTLMQDIKSGKVDPGIAFANFYAGTAPAVEAVQTGDITEKPSYPNARETDIVRKDSVTGKVVSYLRSIQEDAVVRLVISSLPDASAPGGKAVDIIAFVGQEGAAQVQHPLYSRGMEILLKALVKLYYQQPDLQAKIDKASGAAKAKLQALLAANRKTFPPEINSYLHHLGQIESESGGLAGHDWTDADYQEYEKVAQIAQDFYAKKEGTGLEKRALAIFTSYIAMATNSNPVQEKDGLQEGGLDAEPMAQLQKALTSFEKGQLSGYKTILSWLHDTRINYADWPAQISQQAAEIVADLGYASSDAGQAFAHTTGSMQKGKAAQLDRQEHEAALAARNGWLNLSNLQILSFQMKMLAIAVAKLKYGDMRGHVGIQGDKKMQDEADRLIKTLEQYLMQIEECVKQSRDNLMRQAIAGFYLDLQNAQMSYLYGGALRNQVLDMAAKLEEMESLYLSQQFDKKMTGLRSADESSAMAGNAYKEFLAHLPPDVVPLVKSMDALQAELKSIAGLNDSKAIRQALWPVWKQFAAIAEKLGYRGIPDEDTVDKDSKALSLKQAKLMQAAQQFAIHLNMFDTANQYNLILLQNASSQRLPGVSDHWYSKLPQRAEGAVISGGAKAINGVTNAGIWLLNRLPGVNISYKHIHASYDSLTDAGVEHDGTLVTGMLRGVGDSVSWNSTLFHNFMIRKDLRAKMLDQLRAGDFTGAEQTWVDIDPSGAAQAWDMHIREKAPDDNLYNLDIGKFVAHAPDDRLMVESGGAMQDLGMMLKPIIMAYQLTSAAIDTVVMTVVTLGFGAAVGTTLRAVGGAGVAIARGLGMTADAADVAEGLGDAARAGELASDAADAADVGANLGQDAKDIGTIRRIASSTIGFIGKHLESWGTGMRNVVGLSDVSQGASKAVVLRQMIQSSAKFTVGNAVMMSGVSAGISGVDYLRHPETSNAQNFWDASLEGAIGGLSFGARSGPLFLLMPQASAFGAGTMGKAVRGLADSPGPLNGLVRLGAKLIPGAADTEIGGALIDKGLWGSIGTLGDSPLLEQLARTSAHFGAMVDGALKYMTANSIAENAAQFAAYERDAHKTLGAAEKKQLADEGSSQRTYALRSALSAGDAAGQASWFLIPQNQMGSAKDREQGITHAGALSEMLHQDRGLDIEMATKDQTLYVDKPWLQQSWRERARGLGNFLFSSEHKATAPRMELKVSEADREAAAVERMKDFSGADLLAVTEAPRDEVRGKVLGLSDLKGMLGGEYDGAPEAPQPAGNVVDISQERTRRGTKQKAKKIEAESARTYENLPQRDKLDAQSVRMSDEIQEAARSQLKKWLKNNPDEIAKIRTAVEAEKNGKSGKYMMPDGKGGEIAVRGEPLKKLANLAALQEIASGAQPRTAAEKTKAYWERVKDSLSGKPIKDGYQVLVSDLRGEIHGDTAKEIIDSTQQALQNRIDLRKSQGKENKTWALEQVRSTIESDAYIDYVNRKMAEDISAYRKGNLSDAQLDADVKLFRDVWEEGVFGKRFKKSADQKGNAVWDIPPEYQFKDAHGHLVTSFRDFQAASIESVIKDLAAGRNKIFRLLETGGGKTLLSFTLLSLFNTMAQMKGREGAIYATSNANLVAQANEAYRAFFKGREAPFKIETYEQVMLDQALAQAHGRLSPYQTHYVINDEYDQLGTQTALSLGSPNGRLSFPSIDPIQAAMREGALEARGTLHDEFGGKDLDEKSIAELQRENPAFAAKMDALSAHTASNIQEAIRRVNSKAFKAQVLDIHSELYRKAQAKGQIPEFSSVAEYEAYFHMTPEQVYGTMQREVKHAFGEYALPGWVQTAFHWAHLDLPMPEALQKATKSRTFMAGLPLDAFVKVGVIERQFGSLQDWIKDNLEGAYIVGSFSPEKLSAIYARGEEVDPSHPEELHQYHADVPMANLDTKYRGALQLIENKPLELKYDNMAVVDFAALNAAAREGGGVVVALSGTLPGPERRFLSKQGWKVSGEGSAPAQVEYKAVEPGMADSVLAKDVAQDAKINGAGKEKVLHIVFLPNKAQQRAFEAKLEQAGVPASRRSVVVTPDSNLQENERLMYQVRDAKNLKALSKGDVDVAMIVGRSGIRGLDIDFGAYAGGRIEFDIIDPQDLSMTDLIQLVGRAAEGRLPKNTSGKPSISVSFHGIVDSKDLPESLRKIEGTPEFKAEFEKYVQQAQKNAEEAALKSSGIYDYKAPQLPKFLRFMQKKAPKPSIRVPSGTGVGGGQTQVVVPQGSSVEPMAKRVKDEEERPLWSSSPNVTWQENARRYWNSHRSKFPEYKNWREYVKGANEFVNRPPLGTLAKTQPNGDVVLYNPQTNTFVIRTADGVPRAMFKPKAGMKYAAKYLGQ